VSICHHTSLSYPVNIIPSFFSPDPPPHSYPLFLGYLTSYIFIGFRTLTCPLCFLPVFGLADGCYFFDSLGRVHFCPPVSRVVLELSFTTMDCNVCNSWFDTLSRVTQFAPVFHRGGVYQFAPVFLSRVVRELRRNFLFRVLFFNGMLMIS